MVKLKDPNIHPNVGCYYADLFERHMLVIDIIDHLGSVGFDPEVLVMCDGKIHSFPIDDLEIIVSKRSPIA